MEKMYGGGKIQLNRAIKILSPLQACQDDPDGEEQRKGRVLCTQDPAFSLLLTERPFRLLKAVWDSLPSGAERSVQPHEQRTDAGKTGASAPAAH